MNDLLAPFHQAQLHPREEADFLDWIKKTAWFQQFSQHFGEAPNLNDQQFDYRRAWLNKVEPSLTSDGLFHWPSRTEQGGLLKAPDHPTSWKEDHMRATGQDPDWGY